MLSRYAEKQAFSNNMEPTGIEPATPSLQSYKPIDVTPCNSNDLQTDPDCSAAKSLALSAIPTPKDPDLAALVSAWPKLPAALKAGIVAMVKASRG